jgi:hypothetical protein
MWQNLRRHQTGLFETSRQQDSSFPSFAAGQIPMKCWAVWPLPWPLSSRYRWSNSGTCALEKLSCRHHHIEFEHRHRPRSDVRTATTPHPASERASSSFTFGAHPEAEAAAQGHREAGGVYHRRSTLEAKEHQTIVGKRDKPLTSTAERCLTRHRSLPHRHSDRLLRRRSRLSCGPHTTCLMKWFKGLIFCFQSDKWICCICRWWNAMVDKMQWFLM